MLFFDHLSRLLVLNALVRSVVVVLHFPEPELIFSIFGILEANEVEQVFIVGSIGAFNEAIVPRFTLFDQSVDAAIPLDSFGKLSFPIWMMGVFHGKAHGIIREGYKKGGNRSKAFSYTLARVLVS